eukprot:6210684-Pleurochrysis_carterae.AAC.1
MSAYTTQAKLHRYGITYIVDCRLELDAQTLRHPCLRCQSVSASTFAYAGWNASLEPPPVLARVAMQLEGWALLAHEGTHRCAHFAPLPVVAGLRCVPDADQIIADAASCIEPRVFTIPFDHDRISLSLANASQAAFKSQCCLWAQNSVIAPDSHFRVDLATLDIVKQPLSPHTIVRDGEYRARTKVIAICFKPHLWDRAESHSLNDVVNATDGNRVASSCHDVWAISALGPFFTDFGRRSNLRDNTYSAPLHSLFCDTIAHSTCT